MVGRFIDTASFVALRSAATAQIAYTASKGAVFEGAMLALTRELAVVHARENNRANALCPGSLRSDGQHLDARCGRDLEAAMRLGGRVETGTRYANRRDDLGPPPAWTGVEDSGQGVSLSRLVQGTG